MTLNPENMRHLARWLFALSHETDSVASLGLIGPDKGWNVVEGRPELR